MKAPDPIFQSVSDEKNFTLAWERVRYFDRKDSRDWLGLKIFASNKDHSLQVLREAFLEDTFEPSYPEIKFLPKKSQTLRTYPKSRPELNCIFMLTDLLPGCQEVGLHP